MENQQRTCLVQKTRENQSNKYFAIKLKDFRQVVFNHKAYELERKQKNIFESIQFQRNNLHFIYL